nr:MAG TPA: hypothetical protein [Microviridae sp.]
MKRFRKNPLANGIYVSACIRSKKFLPVQPGLSYDTGTLHKMWKQGLPINPQNANEVYDDGSTNSSWEIPLASHRFVDPAEVWQAQQQARYKISRAYKSRQLKESE